MDLFRLVSRRCRTRWSSHQGRRPPVIPVQPAGKAKEERTPPVRSLRPRWLRHSSSSTAPWRPSLGSISEDGSFLCVYAAGRSRAEATARTSRGEGTAVKRRSAGGCTRGGSSSASTDSYRRRRDFSMSVVSPALVPAPFLF